MRHQGYDGYELNNKKVFGTILSIYGESMVFTIFTQRVYIISKLIYFTLLTKNNHKVLYGKECTVKPRCFKLSHGKKHLSEVK